MQFTQSGLAGPICPRMLQVIFLTISHAPGCEIGPQFKRSFTIFILIYAIYPQVDLYALEVECFGAQKTVKQALHQPCTQGLISAHRHARVGAWGRGGERR